MLRAVPVLILMPLALVACTSLDNTMLSPRPPQGSADQRRLKIVEAGIQAVHAYQLLMTKTPGEDGPRPAADAAIWSAGGLSDERLKVLVAHQKSLLKESPEAVRDWADGKPSTFDPAKDLAPLVAAPLPLSDLELRAGRLPINAYMAYLHEASKDATELQIRSVASIFQMMLDVDRDATELQQLYHLYVTLGLPVHLGQLMPLQGTDQEFLAIGQELAPRMPASPFSTNVETLQMMGRKNWNWGRRHTGERDKTVLAGELLREPEMVALLPRLQAMPAQKIAVIGHSFTMNVNWASPSAFVPIVSEVFQTVNPKVEIRQWEAGGLSAVRAYSREKFYEKALAWGPDRVLLVVSESGQANQDALRAMIDGFSQAGIEVMIFDRLRTSRPRPTAVTAPGSAPLSTANPPSAPAAPFKAHVIEVGRLLAQSPDEPSFVALDGAHMTEPWHRLMAREWIKFLCGARPAALPVGK